ncbi:hypothetical protein [Actinophytocola xinjiangensis]|uniref:hypothetical protein n=1 Tax=Actinophytocola xinjiangensis TaxID=485602 RepID=UPI0012B7456B|nr:hypothetical protein [Actinophytocola xinjiangensis]
MTRGQPAERDEIVFLSRLLPTAHVGDPVDYWDHAEQGLAIEILSSVLSDRHVPVAGKDRDRLMALARAWGVVDRVRGDLRWCPDPDLEDQPWRVIEGTDFSRVVERELAAEISSGHPLHGKDLTAWLACEACDDVLVRVDDQAAQAGKAPYLCAVTHPTWSEVPETPPWPRATLLTTSGAALDLLLRCWA